MKTNNTKIREYILVKNEFNHPSLEELNCYDWDGDLSYVSEVYRMLKNIFRMDRLSTEMSYVVALDHAKKPKGVCQIGHGDTSEVLTSMQSVFSFLLLVGANSFYVVHNHVSDMPEASEDDKKITFKTELLTNMFGNLEFNGHMIINPKGYIIDGGKVGKARNEHVYEVLGNGMAACYIFDERIVDTEKNIRKMLGYDNGGE